MLRIALGPLRPQYSTKDGTLNIYLTGLRCARVMHLASETSERGDGPMTALIRSSAVAAQVLLVVATSVAVVVGGLSLGERQRARVPEAQAASAPTSLATHENAALGYRIDLRRSYRPATSSLSKNDSCTELHSNGPHIHVEAARKSPVINNDQDPVTGPSNYPYWYWVYH